MCGLGDLREHNEISPTTDDPRKHPTTPPSPTISPTPSISSLCGSHTHPPDTMMVTPTLHPPCHHPHLMPSWTDPDGRTDPDGPGRTRTGRTDPDGPGRTDGRTDSDGRTDGRTDGPINPQSYTTKTKCTLWTTAWARPTLTSLFCRIRVLGNHRLYNVCSRNTVFPSPHVLRRRQRIPPVDPSFECPACAYPLAPQPPPQPQIRCRQPW